MVGTWVVAQDGADKVIMVDGRPWVASKDNPTKLLDRERAQAVRHVERRADGQREAVRLLPGRGAASGVDNFTNGTISVKFKTIAGDADRASGILFNVKPNGDWLAVRYNDTENNVALWEFHNGMRRNMQVQRSRASKFMLDRAAWHELKLTIDGADLKAWLDGELALEYTLGSEPGPGRNGAPPNPDLFPANNAGAAAAGRRARSACGRRPTRTSYFKDYVVEPEVITTCWTLIGRCSASVDVLRCVLCCWPAGAAGPGARAVAEHGDASSSSSSIRPARVVTDAKVSVVNTATGAMREAVSGTDGARRSRRCR